MPCARVCPLWRQPKKGLLHELRDLAILKVGSKGGVWSCAKSLGKCLLFSFFVLGF